MYFIHAFLLNPQRRVHCANPRGDTISIYTPIWTTHGPNEKRTSGPTVAARIFKHQLGPTVPLYRLNNKKSGDRLYTRSTSERNAAARMGEYTQEGDGIAGYVYATQICESVPLYRLYNGHAQDHLYTADEGERHDAVGGKGYILEGIAGYVVEN
ncbi:hypothetical protein C8J57DRAFT_1049238 [Mycena rebaudengoi]|nr:hypothetical protein C8J57DRAFT_1049238 [Mycena rebaudengoi]